MPVQQNTIGVLGRLFWHSIILQEHLGGCADTTGYYRSTGEAVLAQYNTTGEVERLCWYNKVLYEYWLGCAGRVEYHMSIGETVLVQKSTTGALHGEAVLIQQSSTGLGRLCWYMSIRGTLGIFYGTVVHYKNTREAVSVSRVL